MAVGLGLSLSVSLQALGQGGGFPQPRQMTPAASLPTTLSLDDSEEPGGALTDSGFLSPPRTKAPAEDTEKAPNRELLEKPLVAIEVDGLSLIHI